jgi:exosortase K
LYVRGGVVDILQAKKEKDGNELIMSSDFWNKVRSILKKYSVFYAMGLAAAFALKLYYSRAGVDELDWILAPTTWWVQVLSGINFKKVPGVGYINHNCEFVIAPVCAGINFMIIAFTTLVFSFMHHMRTVGSRVAWMILSLVIIYPYTILVNSLRIIPSIYLLQMDFYGGLITTERVHTMEGTLVYFTALLFLYHIADKVVKRLSSRLSTHFSPRFSPYSQPHQSMGPAKEADSLKPAFYAVIKWSLPVFFYFSITLGIPFLNGAYRNDNGKFLEYTLLVSGVCFSAIAVTCLFILLNKCIKRKIVGSSL